MSLSDMPNSMLIVRHVRGAVLALAGLCAGPAVADCGPTAWSFGMSPEQVSALAECGPYKSFANGDLETDQGTFEGKKENFQFFFAEGKLRRIGVYLYEGQDIEAASADWVALRATLVRLFGAVETPGIGAAAEKADASFATNARELVVAEGKAQMAPLLQAKDAFTFASFARYDVSGETFYRVTLYFDVRP